MNPCLPLRRIPHRVVRYATTGHWHRTTRHVAHHASALALAGCVAGVGVGVGVIGWEVRAALPEAPALRVVSVPEPASLALLGVGIVGLVGVRRRG